MHEMSDFNRFGFNSLVSALKHSVASPTNFPHSPLFYARSTNHSRMPDPGPLNHPRRRVSTARAVPSVVPSATSPSLPIPQVLVGLSAPLNTLLSGLQTKASEGTLDALILKLTRVVQLNEHAAHPNRSPPVAHSRAPPHKQPTEGKARPLCALLVMSCTGTDKPRVLFAPGVEARLRSIDGAAFRHSNGFIAKRVLQARIGGALAQ